MDDRVASLEGSAGLPRESGVHPMAREDAGNDFVVHTC